MTWAKENGPKSRLSFWISQRRIFLRCRLVREDRANLGDELRRAGEAGLGQGRQATVNDLVDAFGQVAVDLAGGPGRRRRRVPRDKFIENRGQREDIGSGRGRGASDHLGRKVGADGNAFRCGRIGQGGEGAREAQVGDPDPSRVTQPDGGGMDTPMADMRVRRLDSVGGMAK